MFKQLKGQKGFTLIELMIVVAIIGILAAIAIPNFLQYQMKGRQSEAKTNLQAIKTSEVAFQAERGCYIGIAAEGVVVPAANVKTIPFTWATGLAPTPPPVNWCIAAGVFGGFFNDIGFRATGNVNYRYGVDTTVGPIAGYTPQGVGPSCPIALAGTAAVALPVQTNFIAVAQSNLDGDNVGPTAGVSTWDSTVDHGAADCTTGVY